jgi:N-acetylmuramoyl-L-alanine amidase
VSDFQAKSLTDIGACAGIAAMRETVGRAQAWLQGVRWHALGLLFAGITTPAVAFEVGTTRVSENAEHTRLVFDLSRSGEHKVFTLDDPPRVVIDLKGATIGKGYTPPAARGLVRGVRTGTPEKGMLRIVVDTTSAVRPRSFVLTPSRNRGNRLVVDLVPTTGAAAVSRVVRAPAAPVDGGRLVTVAIDPGHGGADPGAIGPRGTREKDVVLAISRKLADAINREPGMRAVLIRDGDQFIALRQRYEKAREAEADLFLSIHADAIAHGRAAGSSVYMLSTRGASSQAARWLADRENASDLVGGVTLGGKDNTLAAVLLDLSQGATLQASDQVAGHVLKSLSRFGRVHKQEVQHANFVVLRSPDVPSILIETAFISNAEEEKRLRDAAHQDKLAGAILEGVRNYFHAHPLPGTWIAANRQRPREHIVMRGETLALIAQQHGVSLNRLRAENKIGNSSIRPGDVLRLPGS